MISNRNQNRIDLITGEGCQHWHSKIGWSMQLCANGFMRYYVEEEGIRNYNLSTDYQFDSLTWKLKDSIVYVDNVRAFKLISLANDSLWLQDLDTSWGYGSLLFIKADS